MELEARTDGNEPILSQEGSNSSNSVDFEESRRVRRKRMKAVWKISTTISLLTLLLGSICFAYFYFFLSEDRSPVLCCKEWLNVHLIPHSHDDVGWIRTPEVYYSNDVKYILDHVIQELQANPTRKFVYVETYFFWKWWQEQGEEVKSAVKTLLKNGQLEFVGGGWCMSDEAVTHYQSFIDQSTWGFRRLNDSFGNLSTPQIGWQIDSFGHSKGIASLLALMGFSGLFFARIDLDDHEERINRKKMEFIWQGNRYLGTSSNIFVNVLYKHYSAPRGFDFEMEPPEKEIHLHEFASHAREQAEYYRTNDIVITMGDDFRYYRAHLYFKKIDALIRLANDHPEYKLKLMYSTPSQYLNILHKKNVSWPFEKDDFFPYASSKHQYWTGYYTSRPTFKYFERLANNFLQISKQLLLVADLGEKYFEELTTLREAVAVLQHHDAITGTAQQHVTDHYSETVHYGIMGCSVSVNGALKKLTTRDENGPQLDFVSCLKLNISECDISENNKKFVVTVYNPLNYAVDEYVRFPVLEHHYTVFSAEGEKMTVQILNISSTVRQIRGRNSLAGLELLFYATDIPPLGFKSYFVMTDFSPIEETKTQPVNKPQLKFKNGILFEVFLNGRNYSLTQSISYYKGSHHWTGAYIFKPVDEITHEPQEGKPVHLKILNHGPLVTEYEQIFSEWTSQIIRVYRNKEFVEFEWLVGPIPVSDFFGKEVILRYSSNISNNDVFYTDVNGRELEMRVRNHRKYHKKISEPVSGNYYPVTSRIAIRDNFSQLFIMNDRPQGGSSLKSGDVELMVHRRLCYDDGKGVDEPLNETAYGEGLIARGKHWVMFGRAGDYSFERRAKLLAQERHSAPWLFFSKANGISFEDWKSNHISEFSALVNSTIPDIRILTLEPWRHDTILLRLEYIFSNSSNLSHSSIFVNLKTLFSVFEVVGVKETTLGGDRWLSEVKKYSWRPQEKSSLLNDWTVKLSPMQIKTFNVRIKPKY